MAFGWFARAVDWSTDPGIWATWTDQAAQYGIVAVPVALLMIGGEFDLSAGVMIGSSGLLLGYLTTFQDMNVWPAIALVLVFGLVVGFLNGITVVKTMLPSFIVTLATFFVLQGVNAALTLRLTGTTAIGNIDTVAGFESARRFLASEITQWDFKVKVLWWIGLTIVGAWVLSKSRFGNWIFSAGGDPVAARNVGVPVARTKVALFMATSATASLMGIIEALELRSMQSKGDRARVHLHHLRRRRRLPPDRRVRVRDRHRLRRRDARDGGARDHVLPVGLELDVHVPGRDPLRRRHAQHDHPSASGERDDGSVRGAEAGSLLEVESISKYFGNVVALKDVSTHVDAGEVTCILGDNGAGKSTFIKIVSGVYEQDEGRMRVDGSEVRFDSPRDARDRGIATVYQDLAMVPLMSIWRNFFLGEEPTRWRGRGTPRRRFAKRTAQEEMAQMGIDVRDPDQPVGTLSGGERQAVAIARAIYFGARVLILDEPTSALGVKQAGIVLRYILQAPRGVGVIFITHNPHHAFPVGDHFVLLNRGRVTGDYRKGDVTRDELVRQMAGGAELDQLTHELEGVEHERMTGELEVPTVGRVGVDLYGEELHAGFVESRRFQKSVGGSPTNVAVAAARLGRRAAVLTKVGDDGLGEYVRHALGQEFGVDTRFVGTPPDLKTRS